MSASRFLAGVALLSCVLLLGASGCKKGASRTSASQARLTLLLPPSIAGLPVALEVDGHAVALPTGDAPLLITPPEEGDGARVSYTFWPDAHTKIIRTQLVKVAPGESAEVDLRTEPRGNIDRVYAASQETPTAVVEAMCQLAKIGKDDVVYDIGCGDGKVIVAAVQKGGAREAVGLDYDDERERQAHETIRQAGLVGKARVLNENVLERTDFSRPNVIFLSWTSPVNERLKPLLQTTLRHGTRIVSCRSDLGDWRPDETRTVKARGRDGREVEHTLRLWTIRHKQVPNLYLELPYSDDPPPYAPERVSKLLIDGKDYSQPRVRHRSLYVEPAKGQDQLTVAFTFWPNTYTEITRTKVVKWEKGKPTRASLTQPVPGAPDKIRPIFVPTPDEVVDRMCQMARIGKDDVVYDIGCGDGRLVIQGVKKYGAKKGIGIDINPQLVKLCRELAGKAGVSDKVTFEARDALAMKDFSEATVLLLYLGDHLNEALRPTLQKTLKKGTRIVSHRFKMGDWAPDRSEVIKAKDNDGSIAEFHLHLWTIK